MGVMGARDDVSEAIRWDCKGFCKGTMQGGWLAAGGSQHHTSLASDWSSWMANYHDLQQRLPKESP